jgi:hypothetical protein
VNVNAEVLAAAAPEPAMMGGMGGTLSTVRGRRGCRGLAAAALALGALLVGAAPAGAKPAAAPKPLSFSCAEAMPDGTLVDPHLGEVLAALAASVRWSGGDAYGAPTDCHRQVRLFCGPDLDHDGDPDAIVEVSWWFGGTCAPAPADGEITPVTKTFLASKHGAAWRAVAALIVTADDDTAALSATTGDQSAAPPARRSSFVRRANGETAIRVEWSKATSDTGCALGGYEVFALRKNALHKLEGGDSSRACTPCGCDHH